MNSYILYQKTVLVQYSELFKYFSFLHNFLLKVISQRIIKNLHKHISLIVTFLCLKTV